MAETAPRSSVSAAPPEPVRRRLRSAHIALIVLSAIIVISVCVLLALNHRQSTEGAQDLNGNVVQLDPGIALDPDADAVPDIGERFIVPTLGADFALGEISEVDGQLTPPGFTSVYIVRNRGVLPADAALGTTYAITHSLRHGGRAPGNSLFNQADGNSRLIQDDEVDVAGNRYQVVSTETIDKRDLPGRADIWNNTPGRLVVITCLQNKENAVSDQNFVIVAQLK